MNQRRKNYSRQNSRGFTLIELSLSMAFVAILLLAIAIMTIQISRIYNKGITLRQVNEAGRAISSDLERTIGGTQAFDTTEGGVAYVNQTTGGVLGGRLCLGDYSYIWNYAQAFQSGGSRLNKYVDGTDNIRFIKVSDPNAALCKGPSYPAIPTTNVTNLLEAGDRDLMIWNFGLEQSSASPADGQALYHIQFTIGTSGEVGGIDTLSDTVCKPPSDSDSYDDFCSVNDFDIVVRAGNEAGGEN